VYFESAGMKVRCWLIGWDLYVIRHYPSSTKQSTWKCTDLSVKANFDVSTDSTSNFFDDFLFQVVNVYGSALSPISLIFYKLHKTLLFVLKHNWHCIFLLLSTYNSTLINRWQHLAYNVYSYVKYNSNITTLPW